MRRLGPRLYATTRGLRQAPHGALSLSCEGSGDAGGRRFGTEAVVVTRTNPTARLERVRTGQVVAFRLRAHHLVDRQPAGKLHDVAGACGVQDSPPGSALLALNARVEDVTRAGIDRLLGVEKSLLQTWSMRGSPFLFPTVDAAIFTTGVLPATEAGRLHLVVGVEGALRALGMGLDETVDIVAAHVKSVLSRRQLAIDELGRQLAESIASELEPGRRDVWQADGPYGSHQPLGEGVVHFCIRLLTLRGLVCFAPRSQNKAPFVLAEEWLGHALPQGDPEGCRAALLRRYLHSYGPSSCRDFAAWLGVQPGDVDAWWTTIESELTPVDVDGREAWMLTRDLNALRSTSETRGVRLLPPSDPYLQMRDRDKIVEKRFQPEVWKTAGAPGAVLANGNIVGTWRPRKVGRTLTLKINTWRSLDTTTGDELREEAERVAELRGASTTELQLEDATR